MPEPHLHPAKLPLRVTALLLALLLGACAAPNNLPPPEQAATPPSPTAEPDTELTIAVSPDIPPYVMDGAARGVEVEILRAAFPDREVRFVQLPYAELQTAVPSGKASVSAGVQEVGDEEGVFYSGEFITFVNAAISKRAAGMEIDTVADLAGHRVLTWQDAYRELGPEFEALFAPGAPHHGDYEEFADQTEQVRRFWEAEEAVIVIDRAIFSYASREMGHEDSEVEFHSLFPPVTDFRVAFADAELRDAFDRRIGEMCASGEYQGILARNELELPRTVCDS